MTNRIAVVTGTRAEFGLLRSTMCAIDAHPALTLLVVAAGAHLLGANPTVTEVRGAFQVAATVPMQRSTAGSRLDDATALGRGIQGFSAAFRSLRPDWVVALGDRTEAFAAAAAASIGGIPVAHLHGGDRAEGVADEAMRHAITKLAHAHFPATRTSASRILQMGEPERAVFPVGSPALDGLDNAAALGSDEDTALGAPRTVFLLHPIGRSADVERASAAAALDALHAADAGPTLALGPNHDPGASGILDELLARSQGRRIRFAHHLPRSRFLGLLRCVAQRSGVLVGNSSAGIIEAPALPCATVDIGNRQRGRERVPHTLHAPDGKRDAIARAVRTAMACVPTPNASPYGDGRTGARIAAHLTELCAQGAGARLIRKQWSADADGPSA